MGLVFMGSPELACPSLRGLVEAGCRVKLVVTQPDRPAGRGLKMAASPVGALAAELGLPVIKPFKAQQAIESIAALKPDFMVVVAFGQILPAALLEVAPAINLHTSLLPALRGAAPINRAIVNGLKQTGVSTMLIDQGLDTGPILLQQPIAIAAQDTALSLGAKMAALGPELLLKSLQGLQDGSIIPQAQDNRLASLAPRINKQEAILNWQKSAVELDCQVRGFYPWPGSHSAGAIKFFPPTALMPDNLGKAPGTVLNRLADNNFLWVACAQGALGFAQAQAPGKKRISGPEMARWLHGQGITSLNSL